jgi:hypothetical protein
LLLRLLLQRDRWRRKTGYQENLVPGRESKVSSYSENRQMVLAVNSDLLASRRSLALDWEVLTELRTDRPKMPMELQVDRLRLPMGRYRLKEDKKGYETK